MRKTQLDPSWVTLTIILFSLTGAASCVIFGKGDPQNFLALAIGSSGGYYGYLQNGQQKEMRDDANERHL